MAAASVVRLPLSKRNGGPQAYLVIRLLPKASENPTPLLDCRADVEHDSSVPPIQLLEAHEYGYEWQIDGVIAGVFTDPEEIFQPDTDRGLQGRLRPGLATGTLRVVLRTEEETIGEVELEVRSRKLAYRSEYRCMLRDIAEQMTELLMRQFAASAAHFRPDGARDAVTLYERFEFLRALLASEAIELAFQEVVRRPHVAWEDQSEVVFAGQPLRASAQVVRSIARCGSRVAWPRGRLPFLPRQIEVQRTQATTDTTPNRFIRFALERWRQVVADIAQKLNAQSATPAVDRAKREISSTLERLDHLLNSELLRGVGSLAHFPADDQVLHRRAGYREIFRAYLEFELAAMLSWMRDESSYAAGQRDVAQLYEYWAFIQLASLIAGVVGSSFDISSLLQVRSDGLSIGLRAGQQTVLRGDIERHGRRLTIEFCFNRTFGAGHGSWTVPMRPDYSLIVTAADERRADDDPVILHFDAKYRVNAIQELFGQDEPAGEPGLARLGAKRSDLLKMHAYRDAIHRSAGAYILYPGDDSPQNNQKYMEYRELLPGLGAFVLRPSVSGEVTGAATLRAFIGEVLDHVAQRFSRHERGRFWTEETFHKYTPGEQHPFPFGPPHNDTTVLLGYVKSVDHWAWIQRCLTYNVRTEERRGGIAENADLLHSQLLVLYGPSIDIVAVARIVSSPQRVSQVQMQAAGYPGPRGEYLCIHLSGLSTEGPLRDVSASSIEQLAAGRTGRLGQPVGIPWGQLTKALGIEGGL